MNLKIEDGVEVQTHIYSMIIETNVVETHGAQMDEYDQILQVFISLLESFNIYKENCITNNRKFTWLRLLFELTPIELVVYKRNPILIETDNNFVEIKVKS